MSSQISQSYEVAGRGWLRLELELSDELTASEVSALGPIMVEAEELARNLTPAEEVDR